MRPINRLPWAIAWLLLTAGVAAAGEKPEVSTVLGPLPTPRELARAHEKLTPPPRGDLPVAMSVDADTARRLDRLYRYVTFKDDQLYGAYGSKTIPLGITGIHANEYAERNELFVVEIEPNSPAAGHVRRGDILIGANGRLFGGLPDPRIPMGYALAEAQTEALGGVLTLQLVRDGRFENVPVTLGVEGAYRATWPFGCEKARHMGDRLVDVILHRYSTAKALSGLHSGGSWWHPLILMGSGRDDALELARRSFYGDEKGRIPWQRLRPILESDRYPLPKEIKGSSWALGYELIGLCEYYLLTGDSAILPKIVEKKTLLELGQAPSGSWCHGMGMGGYGEVNATGGTCFLGLALAAECGVRMHPVALKRSADFFRQFAGGGVPYGNHSPSPLGSSDNGKNGMVAVAFYVLGEPEVASGLARPTCYSYLCRENGHADGAFAFAWGPLGAYHAPPGEFHLFMNNLIWYYELARTRDGALRFLRGCHWQRPYGESGPMGLFLMMPRKKLRILGGPKSVFGTRPPDEVEPAARMYKLKQWQPLEKFLNDYLTAHAEGAAADYARRLLAAYRRLQAHAAATRKLIRQDLAKGDAWMASERLAALCTLLGEQPREMADVRTYLDSDAGVQAVQASRKWERPGPGRGQKPPVFDPGPPAPINWVTPPAEAADAVYVEAGDGKGALKFAGRQWQRIDKLPTPAEGEDQDGGQAQADEQTRYLLRRTFTLGDGKCAYMQVETTAGGEVWLDDYRIATFSPDPRGTRSDHDLRAASAGALRPGRNVLTAVLYGVPEIGLTVRVGPRKADLKALRSGLVDYRPFEKADTAKLEGGAALGVGKLGRGVALAGSATLTGLKPPTDGKGRLASTTIAAWLSVPDGRRDELTISCGVPDDRRRKGGDGWAIIAGPSVRAVRMEAKGAAKPKRAKDAPKTLPQLDGEFQHVAWVYDRAANVARIYLNGAAVWEQKVAPDGIVAPDSPVIVRSAAAAKIDELAVWGRPLSAEEILDLVRGGSGLSLGPR